MGSAPPRGYSTIEDDARSDRQQQRRWRILESERLLLLLLVLFAVAIPQLTATFKSFPTPTLSVNERIVLDKLQLKCDRLAMRPAPPASFSDRTHSDRFVEGTPPYLLKNVTVWSGEDKGNELLENYDVLISNGLITTLGSKISDHPKETIVVEGHGAYLTPGIFDVHSHLGVDAAPSTDGADDTNSFQKPILPYLRSLDGINTHDLAFKRSMSGGVTSSLILPGSANNIGGQAFVIKLRPVKGNTPDEMVLEMPYNVLGEEHWKAGDPPRHRHMKAACGENIKRVYKQVRMDLAWNFRSSFEKARSIKIAQDDFCAKVKPGSRFGLEEKYPEELDWEALVDLLRGKVLLNAHCYETTDLAALIRHASEFKFEIAALHHAHEAYLVPDLIKSSYNNTPAVAIFAINARYKREAWRGSEYAAKILSSHNLTVLMKSDHPVLSSQHLLFEAQQAHSFGLPANLALASITTNSARVAGFSHRLGLVRAGFDADLVLWDSHPLQLGATPLQVFIDGIPQLDNPSSAKKLSINPLPPSVASIPTSKNLTDLVARGGNDYGDDGIYAERRVIVEEVKFINVKKVWLAGGDGLRSAAESAGEELYEVLMRDGEMVCVEQSCPTTLTDKIQIIDLKGGSLTPPLTTYGTLVGLLDIIAEPSTTDGTIAEEPFNFESGKDVKLIRAVDGLILDGKHLRIAREAGVGVAVGKVEAKGFFGGLSVAFRVGAKNLLEEGAVVKAVTAVHISVGHISRQKSSFSTQIAKLRQLLQTAASSLSLDTEHEESHQREENYWMQVVDGRIPLVIEVNKLDHIASLILLKREIESSSFLRGRPMAWVILGAAEAYLIAEEIAEAQLGVILNHRSYPNTWDERRSSPGPPLVARSASAILHTAGVKLAIGVPEEWQTRQLFLEASWISKISNGDISEMEALKFVTTNLQEMLGFNSALFTSSEGSVGGRKERVEFVAWENNPFEFGSRPIALSAGDKIELLL